MMKIVTALYYAFGTCFGSDRARKYATDNDLVRPNYHW